jgi:hypothetical protein
MLQVTTFSRQHPAPCNHWTITIQNDATTEQVTFTGLTTASLQQRFDDQRWWVRLAILWLKQKIAGGSTPAQCVGVEILTLANANALLSET